ncbi:MAG: von Willebrand factor type A domain-containing protein [Pseudomonadota bacterium]
MLAYLLVLSALTLAAVALAAGAKVRGVVQIAGVPVPGAVVELKGASQYKATTNKKGAFTFNDVAAGPYQLTVLAPGYQKYAQQLVVAEGKTANLLIELKLQVRAAPEQEAAKSVAPSPVMAEPAGAVADERMAPRRAKKESMSGAAAPSQSLRSAPPGRPMPTPKPRPQPKPDQAEGNTEGYTEYGQNPWTDTATDNLSTFAVDVDTASYTIARRKLREGSLPPPASVRTEEFVNYFKYSDAPPKSGPFNVNLEAAPSPFDDKLTILRVGVKGMEAKGKDRKPVHLTFLVDTSGSMHSEDKIGLLKRSLRFLVDQLQPGDTVALTTYAGSTRVVLTPTGMSDKKKIHDAIEGLSAGGSTAMASGLELAYQQAYENIKGKSVNRVIVCSDGDANVGATKHGDMLTSIKKYAEEGITLSTIGFGMGNYKDTTMEQLSNKGNGNYYYIDGFSQAKRVFGADLMGTLQVIAKDVKIQVEFDKKAVKRYRLVGYENRDIADEDFRNDKVDAGEIGSGHNVVALYEVEVTDPKASWATVRVRWKQPEGSKADEKAFTVTSSTMKKNFKAASPDLRRAVAAAALAENLRGSPFKNIWTLQKAQEIARSSLQKENEEEMELIELIDIATRLSSR